MAEGLKLVVGLGNPGNKYAGTRHNIGFMALERMAKVDGFSFRQQSKLHGLAAETGVGEQRLRLLMPQTYMNDSSRSIRAALDWYGIAPEQLLVLVDDMDLPLGRLRLRARGSAGGHNGLRSLIQHLGSQVFPRLRIGIGAPAATRRIAAPRPCPMCWVRSVSRNRRVSMRFWMGSWTPSRGFNGWVWIAPVIGSTVFVTPRRMTSLPATTAHLRVDRRCFQDQVLEGAVSAGGFEWTFHWAFDRGELRVEPSLGRALIEDALLRFLVRMDYRLEPGGDYNFTVRARF